MRCIAGAAAALALAAVTACGSSGGPAAQPLTAAQVAAQIGATGVQPVNPPTLYAYDECTATLHGRAVDIATFRTGKLRDQWIQAAQQFTGIEQKGRLYAVADG
jgi:hypothetical protein